jgi:hypothetical protein
MLHDREIPLGKWQVLHATEAACLEHFPRGIKLVIFLRHHVAFVLVF